MGRALKGAAWLVLGIFLGLGLAAYAGPGSRTFEHRAIVYKHANGPRPAIIARFKAVRADGTFPVDLMVASTIDPATNIITWRLVRDVERGREIGEWHFAEWDETTE